MQTDIQTHTPQPPTPTSTPTPTHTNTHTHTHTHTHRSIAMKAVVIKYKGATKLQNLLTLQ